MVVQYKAGTHFIVLSEINYVDKTVIQARERNSKPIVLCKSPTLN